MYIKWDVASGATFKTENILEITYRARCYKRAVFDRSFGVVVPVICPQNTVRNKIIRREFYVIRKYVLRCAQDDIGSKNLKMLPENV